MVQIIAIPVGWSMTKEEQVAAEFGGHMSQIWFHRNALFENGTQQLNTLLEDGFTLLSSVLLESSAETLLIYTLHKPDKSG